MTNYEQPELEGLSAEMRKEVEARVTGRQTVRRILATMLLNSILRQGCV